MKTEIILDSVGNEVIIITNENGSQVSMLKAIYDAQQAQVSTPLASQENN